MSNRMNQCQKFQRYFFDFDSNESPLTDSERIEIEHHLQSCLWCQQEFKKEKVLTDLLLDQNEQLTRPAKTGEKNNQSNPALRIAIVTAAAILLLATAIVWSNFLPLRQTAGYTNNSESSNTNLGSIQRRPVFTNASFISSKDSSVTQELKSSNHIELPAGSVASVELLETGSIRVAGPAVLEIDQVEGDWKITFFRGHAKIEVIEGKSVKLVGEGGVFELENGTHVVSSDSTQFVSHIQRAQKDSLQDNDEDKSVTELVDDAMSVFSGGSSSSDDMKRAAELLAKVIEHPDATPTQVLSAKFYYPAALSNAKQHQKALDAATDFLESYPDFDNDVILAIVGDSHFYLGDIKSAKKAWDKLLANSPDSPYKTGILAKLGGAGYDDMESSNEEPDSTNSPDLSGIGNPRFAPESKPPYTSAKQAKQFNEHQRDGYLVVTVGLDSTSPEHKIYQDVANEVQEFHNGNQVTFDGVNFEELKKHIGKYQPANVLFVIPPQLLDVNFQRRVFKMAPTFDQDLQADFAWGYLTARSGDALKKFWQRIQNLHEHGLPNKTWLEASVAGNIESTIYTHNALPPAAVASGFKGKEIYFGVVEQDPDVLKFVDEHIKMMEQASVIVMYGNGDPHGIWLFDGQRNMDPDKHWDFDASKVGHDPENEMVRIKADRFRNLKLNSPIIWSGPCHSGACYRVYVEGDIVSTFGKSDQVELFEMDLDDSLALALIDAGAGSLIVPIASNHGFSNSLETQFALNYGTTLGESIKSTYDDVYQQAGGVPALLIVEPGDSKDLSEPIMQGTGPNRLLIGDPALSLFKPTTIPHEKSDIKWDEQNNKLTVSMEWEKGSHPEAWNIYADAEGRGNRMRIRVPLKPGVDIDPNQLNVTAKLKAGNRKELPCLPFVGLEQFNGRTFLHLQATTNKDGLMHGHHQVTFNVSWSSQDQRDDTQSKDETTAEDLKSKLDVLWHQPLDAPSFGAATVADVDDDGKLEIAFGTYFGDNSARVWNGEDGSELWRHAFKNPYMADNDERYTHHACLDASFRLADLDQDGDLELLVPVSNLGQMNAFDPSNGKLIYTYEPSPKECTDSPATILDFDRDGNLEFLYGTFMGKVHLVDAKSGEEKRVYKVCDHFIQTAPTVVDCNQDGQLDFVVATFKGDNKIYAVDGKSGEHLWDFKIEGDHMGMYHGCSIGDLDNDGSIELVIGAYDGKVYCLNANDGSKKWEVKTDDLYIMSPTAIADLNGDGMLEVVSASQKVVVINHQGDVLWNKDCSRRDRWDGAGRGPSIADLNGDGQLDIATLTGGGVFEVFSGDSGERIYHFDSKSVVEFTPFHSSHGASIADFNGDGRLDVFFVVGSTQAKPYPGHAICLTGFEGSGEGWYMLRHDPQSTGNFQTKLDEALMKRIKLQSPE